MFANGKKTESKRQMHFASLKSDKIEKTISLKLIRNAAIGLVLLLFLATIPEQIIAYELVSSGNEIFVNGPGDAPQKNDTLDIDVDPLFHYNHQLTITTPSKLYRYSGDLSTTKQFILTEEGIYLIELYRTIDRKLSGSIQVITGQREILTIRDQSNSGFENISETTNQSSISKKLLTSDKSTYYIGETVIATAKLPDNTNGNLRIIYEFEGTIQRYNGDPQLITLTPKKTGTHYLVITDINGLEIERYAILVIDRPASNQLPEDVTNNTDTNASNHHNATGNLTATNASQPHNKQTHSNQGEEFYKKEPASNTSNTNSTIKTNANNSFDSAGNNLKTQRIDTTRERTSEEKLLSTALKISSSSGSAKESNLVIVKKTNKMKPTGMPFITQDTSETVYDLELKFAENEFINSMQLNEVAINETSNLLLGAEKIDKSRIAFAQEKVQKAYAIDPTGLNFTNGTIKSTAKGRELWKCKDWHFATQICLGEWTKVMDLIPGQEYTLELTPQDPGFAETGLSTINTDKPTYKPNQTAKIMAVVLDTNGYLVEDANVTIIVSNPNGFNSTFSTNNGNLVQEYAGIYSTFFNGTQLEGNYTMTVISFIGDPENPLTSSMASYFAVLGDYDFDIIRNIPLAIDPWKGPFESSIDIIPLKQNITTYNVTELLPQEVEVLSATGATITNIDNTTLVKWSYLSGNSTLNYTAKAPLITPNLLTLGRIIIEYVIEGVVKLFEEARNWFIAVDPAVSRDQGVIVYGDGTTGVPKKRNWTGTTIQAEESTTMSYGSAIWWQKIRCLQDYEQCILLTSDAGGGGTGNEDLNFVVFYTNNYTWSTATQLTGDMVGLQQNFDVECEDNTGRCLIAYENRTDNEATFTYRIWNGSALSGETAVTVTGATNDQFNWVALYPRKLTNQIGIALQNDEGGNGGTPNVYAGIWNGSNFINFTIITTTGSSASNQRTHRRLFDCAWDGAGLFTCAFGTDGQSWVNFTQYNATSTAWTARGSIYNGTGSEVTQVSLCGEAPWHQRNHNYLGLMVCDNAEDLDGGIWNGTQFSKSLSSDSPTQNPNAECDTNKPDDTMNQNFECTWENSGDQALFVWVDNGEDWVSSATYSVSSNSFSISNWAAGSQVVTDGAADIRSTLLVPNSEDDSIFLTYQDGSNDAGCSYWTGNSWQGTGCNNTQVYENAGPADQRRWHVFDYFRTPPPQPDIEILEPNNTLRVATYTGIVSPSSTSKAYVGSTTALPPGSAAAPILGTEFTSNGYVNISTSDNLRTSSLVTVSGGLRAYQSFNLSVTESIVSMKSIKITHEGYATSAVAQNPNTFYMYAYNWNTDSYDLLTTILPSAVDVVTEYTLTDSFNNYVRYQSIIILMEGAFATGGGGNARAELLTDYISLDIENYHLASQTIRVNATAEDDDGVALCEWALYNGTTIVKNLTRMNPLASDQYFNISSIVGINDALYNVTVFCNDTFNFRTNATAPVFIDNTAPAILLYTLTNNSNLTVSYALFSWNVTDIAFQNLLCNVTIDGASAVSNLISVHGENTTHNITGISDGTHYWNVTCVDNAGNSNTSQTRIFDTDTSAPSVVQSYPSHGLITNLNPIELNFSASDAHAIINCTLRLDGQINGTINNPTSGQTYNFTFVNLSQTTHWWNVTCIDSFGFSNTSTNRNFTLDRTLPTIFLNTTNGAVFNGTTPSLNYTAIDNIDRILSCNITVNSVAVDNNIASPNNTLINRNVSLVDGFKSWYVTCYDDAGNSNVSETRIFNVISGPLVTLYSPANGTITSGQNISFRYVPSDGNGIANCSLYLNGVLNQTNASAINDANNTFVVSLLPEGRHQWYVACYDTSNTIGNSQTNVVFSDMTAPSITLNAPNSGAILTTTPQQFNFTYIDGISNTGVCNLTIDYSTSAGSNLAVNNNTLNTRTSSLTNGIHWWNVTCYDYAGNFNTSQNRNFTVNVTQPINTTVIADKEVYYEGEIAIINVTTRNDTLGVTTTNITLDYIFTNTTYTDVPWWNTSWGRRKPIFINETEGRLRNQKLIQANITFIYGTISSCSSELRIIEDNTLSETSFNVLGGDDVSYCTIIFNATVTANAVNENNYHVYFNNSGSTPSNYPDMFQTNLLYDDFEDGNLNGWTAGTGWDVATNNPLGGGGNDHAHIDGSVTNTAINYTTSFDLTSFDVVNITFRWEIESGWDSGEFIRLDFTNDSGANWILGIDSLNGNVNDGTQIDEIITLNSSFRTQGFGLRFVATVDGTGEEGGFDIVNITGFNTIQENLTAAAGLDQILYFRLTNQTSTFGFYQNNFTTTGVTYGNYSAVALASANSPTTRQGYGSDWFALIADTAGPAITLLYPPNLTTLRSGNISFIYTAIDYANNITNCSIFINGSLISTNSTINESSNNTFIVNSMGEGQYNWSIRCFDNLGSNTTTGQNILYLDDTAPIVTAFSPNATTVQTGLVNFTFSASDNFDTSIYCNVSVGTSPSTSATVFVANPGNGSVLINLTSGTHYWNVTCYDNINNTGYSQTLNFTAADIPLVRHHSPTTGYAANSTSILLEYNLSSSNINNCTLYLNSTPYQTVNSSSIPYTANNGQNNFTLSGLAYSSYSWSVNCYDTNGFNGTDSERVFYLDDAAPNITLNSPSNASTVYSTTIRFNFTAQDVDEALVCNLTINGAVNQTNFAAGASIGDGTQNVINVTGMQVGNYSWSVSCADNAGFTGTSPTYNFTIDSSVSITLVSPANNSFDADGNVTFSYIPNSPADFNLGYCELYVNGSSLQTQVALTSGNQYSFTEHTLAQGYYSWYINCTDSAFVTGISEIRNITVDKTAPTVIAFSPNESLINTSTAFFNWTASDNLAPNLTCTVRINGTDQTPTVTMNNGTVANSTFNNLNDGLLYWNVTCSDTGGLNGTSNTLNFTIRESPIVTLNYPLNANRTRNSNLTFLITPTDNSGFIQSCILILDGLANETNSTSSASGTQKSIYSYNIPEGMHNWTANCTDPSGNTGTSQTVRNFTIDRTAPNITIYYPLEGAFVNTNDVTFSWNSTDYAGVTISCQLFFDEVYNSTVSQVSGTNFTATLLNRSEGPHNWSLNCSDDLGNSRISSTYNFTINSPDLYINNSLLLINNTNPNLYNQIQISANVTNLGGIPANNVVVEFWDGAPTGGINIGNATGTVNVSQYTLFSINWNITPGYHTIWAIIDRTNSIIELNDSNNNASINISVLWANITFPANQTIINASNFSINFTSTDYTTNEINYTVLVDGNPQSPSGTLTSGNLVIYNLTNTGEGYRRITVQVRDSLNRTNNSTSIILIIDYNAPTPIINTANQTWFNTPTPPINISATDNVDSLINYSLFVNGSLDTQGSIPNATSILSVIASRPDGLYFITLQVNDDANNTQNSSSRAIYIDTTAPSITLNSPANNSNFTTSSVNLNFTGFDNLAMNLTCNASVDGSIGPAITSQNGVMANYTASGLSEGSHNWNVTCIDQAGNSNTSENRIFNVFRAPVINLISPPNNTISRNQTQYLLFNATDDTGLQNCTLILNGQLNETKLGVNITNGGVSNFTLNGLNGTYTWAVVCYDNTTLNVQNTSETWQFTVDLDPPLPTILTQNQTWVRNITPQITFNITDNFDTQINYTVFANGVVNATGSVANASLGLAVLQSLAPDGEYTIILQGDDDAGNQQNSTPITLYVDTTPPAIALNAPPSGTSYNSTSVQLNFTPTDNMAPYLFCNLSISNGMTELNINATNGTLQSINKSGLTSGTFYWNVSCYDIAGNSNTSTTFNFTINAPDFLITTANITFNESSDYEEGRNITIYANVYNIGGIAASNVVVQFWRGNPASGGTQINGNLTIPSIASGGNYTINVTYSPGIGVNNIYVEVDPQTIFNGTINEENESNNQANRTFSVTLFQVFAGNLTGIIEIEKQSINLSIYNWSNPDTNGSFLFVADTEGNINFYSLQALGRNSSNATAPNDFAELDSRIGTTNLTDSINTTYTTANQPRATANHTIFERRIENIPIVNSTNSTIFRTGILWDESDGGFEYNGTQDIVFLNPIQPAGQGSRGIYDFEISVPAYLRNYNAVGSSVAFYVELK